MTATPSERLIEHKLGALFSQRHQSVRELITARGGNAANVKEAGPWADETLETTAWAAIDGEKDAQKAVKIVKQAKRLGEKY